MGFLDNFRKNEEKDSAKKVTQEFYNYGFMLSEDEVYKIIKQTRKEYKKQNIPLFVSDFEIVARAIGKNDSPFPVPFEGYAQEICSIYSQDMEWIDKKTKIREIGQKINDDRKQKIVAFRTEKLCENKCKQGNMHACDFSIRLLEIAWDGIGGWRK